jgi:hypothetical protein
MHVERLSAGHRMRALSARPLRLLAVAALLCLGSCKAESPGTTPPVNGKRDAAPKPETLEAPRLQTYPSVTPLKSVALRGNTKGTSLVVKGGATGTLVEMPLPSGDFCVDVPLPEGRTANLELTGLADGLISPATTATVAHNPAAPQPLDPYCTPPACGGGPCPEGETDCYDASDNDFDSWTDFCDLDCSNCTDDPYEPNDLPANVPSLPAGSYSLLLCPCHDDWFAFRRETGKRLHVSLARSEGRASLKLFRAKDAEDGGYKSNTPVAYGTLSGSTVTIDWTAADADWYYLYVYSVDAKKLAGYRLTVY